MIVSNIDEGYENHENCCYPDDSESPTAWASLKNSQGGK